MEYVLRTYGLQKQYRHFKALDGLSINIPKGAIYGFVGKNGAGKTTLIRLISGLQEPTGGEYALYGVNNNDRAISEVRKRMGAMVESPSIYLDMTARDNLKQQYLVLGLPSFDGINEILNLVNLSDTGRKKAKHFSLGMRQRLGIAIALCGNPDFLVLDEPVNGLDPQGIIEIRELILKLNIERGITFLISSHMLDELSRIATNYGFIDRGQLIKEISAAELENECRKRICITVTDVKALCRVLDDMGLEYEIVSESDAHIFCPVKINEFVRRLSDNNCEVISIAEKDENLETYYMNLVGGNHHE